eukprot:jgi/Mesen1/7584/ME000392S06847
MEFHLPLLLYYTGLPRDNPVAPVYEFKSEREFVELLNEGDPVVVAFSVRWSAPSILDSALPAHREEAGAGSAAVTRYTVSVLPVQTSTFLTPLACCMPGSAAISMLK